MSEGLQTLIAGSPVRVDTAAGCNGSGGTVCCVPGEKRDRSNTTASSPAMTNENRRRVGIVVRNWSFRGRETRTSFRELTRSVRSICCKSAERLAANRSGGYSACTDFRSPSRWIILWSSADHDSPASAGLNCSTRAKNAARLAASSSEGYLDLICPKPFRSSIISRSCSSCSEDGFMSES